MLPLAADSDATLLSRIEDAGLNASAPAQQRWVDGWLLRHSPGKAKRARCVNALAVGRRPVEEKLAYCAEVLGEAGLPLFVRITPFTQPPDLDAQLAALGLVCVDETRVMARSSLDALPAADAVPLPAGWRLQPTPLDAFAATIGRLRGSSPTECAAHAQRLAGSPVPCRAVVLRTANGEAAACGLVAQEADLAGLFDVFTATGHRGRGLSTSLCVRLLAAARDRGARSAYLQVDRDNHAARKVYGRLGFADVYGYHYRTPAAG